MKTANQNVDNIEYTLFSDVCYVCKDEGEDFEMLVCDKCDYNTAHLKCLSLKSVPGTTWFCQSCKKIPKPKIVRKRRRRRVKAKKVDINGNTIKRKRRRRYKRKNRRVQMKSDASDRTVDEDDEEFEPNLDCFTSSEESGLENDSDTSPVT